MAIPVRHPVRSLDRGRDAFRRGVYSIPAASLVLVLLLLAALPATASVMMVEEPAITEAGQAFLLLAAVDTRRDDDFWVLRLDGRVGWEPGRHEILELARFSFADGFLEERVLEVADGRIWDVPVIDRRGRLWLQAWIETGEPDEDGYRQNEVRLRVYGEGGDLLADMAGDGELLGVTRAGPGGGVGAVLFIDEGGEDPPRVVVADPFAEERSDLGHFRRNEIGYAGGGCFGGPMRSLAVTPDGEIFSSRIHGTSTLVRAFSASGPAFEGWRLGSDEHPGYGGGMVADGEAVYLSHRAGVTRLTPGDPEPVRWRLGESSPQVLPLGDGAVALLADRRRVRALLAGGELGPVLDLDLPPRGMSFAERDRRRQRTRGARLADLAVGDLVDLAILSAADRGERRRLHREILARDAEAVAAALEEARAAWGLVEPLADLAVAALGEHPAVVGDRLAAEPAWAMLLVHAWELPSRDFVHRLAEAVLADASMDAETGALAEAGHTAFLGPLFPVPADVAALPGSATPRNDRFPAPRFLLDTYLVALQPEELRAPESEDQSLFFVPYLILAQFAEVAGELERRLLDPGHPDHPLTVSTLAGLVSILEEGERMEVDLSRSGAALARRAETWRRHPEPRVARTGLLLATALGDPTGADELLATTPWADPESQAAVMALNALAALRLRTPKAERPRLAAKVLDRLHRHSRLGDLWGAASFAEDLDSDGLAELVGWFDAPATACAERGWLRQQLSARWSAVPVESLVALATRGHPVAGGDRLATPAGGDEPCALDYAFLDALWRRLEGEPALRRDLEERVAATLPAYLTGRGETPPGVGGYGAWVELATHGEEESGLARRLVPTAALERLTAELPAGDEGARRFEELARIADRRGPWSGWLEAVENRAAADPSTLSQLPAGAADRWLGRHRVDEVLLAPRAGDD